MIETMQVCDKNHPRIVHTEGWLDCPLCKALDNAARLRQLIYDFSDKANGFSDDRMFDCINEYFADIVAAQEEVNNLVG